MAYTPATHFVFSQADYTPSTTFLLNEESQQVNFNVTLDDVVGQFFVYQSPVADFAAQLDDVSGQFIVEIVADTPELPTNGYSPGTVFVFDSQNYQPGAAFYFEPPGDLPPDTPECSFNITLDDVAGNFQVEHFTNLANFAATLDDATGHFDAEFDYNVHRLTVSELHSSVENAQAVNIKYAAQRNDAIKKGIKTASQQQAATATVQKISLSTRQAAALKIRRCGTVDDATRLTKKTAAPVQDMIPISFSLASNQQQAEQLQKKTCSVAEQMTPVNTDPIHIVVEDSGLSVKTERHIRIFDDPNPYTPTPDFVLDKAASADGKFVFDVVQGQIEFIRQQFFGVVSSQFFTDWQIATPLTKKLCSLVENARQPPPGTSLWVDHPREPPIIPPGHETFIIPEQTTYIMQHNLSVTLLDGTPVNMSSVDISLDADSFAWSFSGVLADKTQKPLLEQTGQVPVQLIVNINQLPPWKIVVKHVKTTTRFAKKQIQIEGDGLSILLGNPHQIATSATQGSDLTVQQIADLQLPNGWSINWTAKTWLVPGGAYSHQNRTPIQAIMDIARNIGAIVVPATDSQVLNIRPRYSVLPWQFEDAAVDVIIPESPLTEVTEQQVVESQINGVYVHGNEISGELGWCRLNGTAGDHLATTESNNLLTDSIGLRAIGERILAAHYTQPVIQSMTLPIDGGDFPLLAIGQLIETSINGTTVRGIVNSVSINASFAKARQNIQIGEETANKWTLFKDLLPADPLLVATLSSTDGKTSIMTLLDNGVVRVRGTGTEGNKYYIRSGKIDGEAPNLVQSEIVV